jgi:hypothetical protein
VISYQLFWFTETKKGPKSHFQDFKTKEEAEKALKTHPGASIRICKNPNKHKESPPC